MANIEWDGRLWKTRGVRGSCGPEAVANLLPAPTKDRDKRALRDALGHSITQFHSNEWTSIDQLMEFARNMLAITYAGELGFDIQSIVLNWDTAFETLPKDEYEHVAYAANKTGAHWVAYRVTYVNTDQGPMYVIAEADAYFGSFDEKRFDSPEKAIEYLIDKSGYDILPGGSRIGREVLQLKMRKSQRTVLAEISRDFASDVALYSD